MCLAVPARIVEVEGDQATVDVLGNRRPANLAMVPEAKMGDYVLVHAGFAITVMSGEEADESLRIWREYDEAQRSHN